MFLRTTLLDGGGSIDEYVHADGSLNLRLYYNEHKQLHRDGGPAHVSPTNEFWYRNSRIDGPAVYHDATGVKRVAFYYQHALQLIVCQRLQRILVCVCKVIPQHKQRQQAILAHWLILDLAWEVMHYL